MVISGISSSLKHRLRLEQASGSCCELQPSFLYPTTQFPEHPLLVVHLRKETKILQFKSSKYLRIFISVNYSNHMIIWSYLVCAAYIVYHRLKLRMVNNS